MSEIENLRSWLPVTRQLMDDAQEMQCTIWLGFAIDMTPLTAEEERTGWRTRPHGDHEHTYAVGWRREQQDREIQAKIDAEKAACPYVACTCGWHED